MISSGTLRLVSYVMERYLTVLGEHPDAVPPDFKLRLVNAAADIERELMLERMDIKEALEAVPTETPAASLLSRFAKG